LVRAITGVIPGHLDRYAVESLRRRPPDNLTAYDCELRGRWALNHWSEGLTIALEWFEKAIKADPNYALAHAGLAMTYSSGLWVLGQPQETALALAKEHARKAIALDDRNPTVIAYAAFTFSCAGDYVLASNYATRAVSLNPNDPFVLYVQADTLLYAGGDPKEVLEWLKKSELIEAYAPDDYRIDTLEDCYYILGDYEKIIALHNVYRLPADLKLVLAAAFAQAGQLENARAAIEEYELTRPAGHEAATTIRRQMNMFALQEHRDHWLEGYRKAGIAV
jgi:adenylate cyclase